MVCDIFAGDLWMRGILRVAYSAIDTLESAAGFPGPKIPSREGASAALAADEHA